MLAFEIMSSLSGSSNMHPRFLLEGPIPRAGSSDKILSTPHTTTHVSTEKASHPLQEGLALLISKRVCGKSADD